MSKHQSDYGRVAFSSARTDRVFPHLEFTPGRIAGVYAVFGVAALVASDVLFPVYLSDPVLAQVQALKGFGEIVLTAGLIFALTRRSHIRLRNQTRQAKQARDELNLLHRVMRHNLRNDLNVIHGYINMVKPDIEDETIATYCEKILATTTGMIQYSEHVRRIRKVTDISPHRPTIDLAALITRVQSSNQALSNGVEVTTDVPEDVHVTANPMLEEAVDELITNAVAHNDAPTPRVNIEVRFTDDDMVDIRITDNGPGIPEEELEMVRTNPAHKTQHSKGLGLWFVDWTVRHSGGQFHIEPRDTGGTRAVIRLHRAAPEQR